MTTEPAKYTKGTRPVEMFFGADTESCALALRSGATPLGTVITMVLADDHAVVRQGSCALVKVAGGFKVVGEARTGRRVASDGRTGSYLSRDS